MMWSCINMVWLSTLLILSVSVTAGAAAELSKSNDLNLALQFIISEMVKSNFFLEQWSYFPFATGVGVPVPILDSCYEGRIVDRTTADSSLTRVLDSQQLRIGVSTILAGRPLLYSTTQGAEETDLTAGNLDGYEIACAREATLRLGQLYNIQPVLEPVFVPIDGDDFFDSLRDAQLNSLTDIIWSGVTVRDSRQEEVDFVCTTFQTDTVIGAAPGVEIEEFDPNGPPINLTCIAVYCSIDVPPPFVKVEFNGDVSDALQLLAQPDNGFDYHIRTIEQLATFFAQSCPDCEYAQIPPIATNYWAPFTAYKDDSNNNNNNHNNQTIDHSNTTIAGPI